MLAEW